MHIRIDIPRWGWKEILLGVTALVSSKKEHSSRLRCELERAVPGWTPILVSSGRYALTLAIRSLTLEGRRIAVPGYVCPSVLTGLRAARAEPVPIDCQPLSIRFDPELLTQAVADRRVDAILAVNTYGLDQDFALLDQLGLQVIEDAAYQAACREPASRQWCGTRGDAGVWSFNFKALTGVGGGVLFIRDQRGSLPKTDDTGAYDTQEVIRFFNYAMRSIARHRIPACFPGAEAPSYTPEVSVRETWLQMRKTLMSELQAAVIFAQWQSRHKLARMQQINSAHLAEAIAQCDAFTPLAHQDGATMVHLFPLLVKLDPGRARAAAFHVREFLHVHGIQTETPYPMILGSSAALPNADQLADHLILVPCNPSLGEQQMRWIASVLKNASQEL